MGELGAKVWFLLFAILFVPLAAVGGLNWIFRKKGGIGRGWGVVFVALMAGIMGLLLILDKVK